MADLSRLPGPVADCWDWQLQAACRGQDVETFFHPENERGMNRSRRDDAAKAICRTCPVLQECARHALAVREPYGVWGGMTEDERAAMTAARDETPAIDPVPSLGPLRVRTIARQLLIPAAS